MYFCVAQVTLAAFPAAEDVAVFDFFVQNTSRAEVVGPDDHLQRLYFPKPVICNYLSKLTRINVRAVRGNTSCTMPLSSASFLA